MFYRNLSGLMMSDLLLARDLRTEAARSAKMPKFFHGRFWRPVHWLRHLSR